MNYLPMSHVDAAASKCFPLSVGHRMTGSASCSRVVCTFIVIFISSLIWAPLILIPGDPVYPILFATTRVDKLYRNETKPSRDCEGPSGSYPSDSERWRHVHSITLFLLYIKPAPSQQHRQLYLVVPSLFCALICKFHSTKKSARIYLIT